MFDNLSPAVNTTLWIAASEAHELRCVDVAGEHILIALAQDNGEIGALLERQGASALAIRQHVLKGGYSGGKRSVNDIRYGFEATQIITAAFVLSNQWNHDEVTSAHILSAMLQKSDDIRTATELLAVLKIDIDVLRRRVENILKLMALKKSDTQAENVVADSESNLPDPIIPTKAIPDYFSKESADVIEFAQSYSQLRNGRAVGLWELLYALHQQKCYLHLRIEQVMKLPSVNEHMITDGVSIEEASPSPVDTFTDEVKSALMKASALTRTFAPRPLLDLSFLFYGIISQIQHLPSVSEADKDCLAELEQAMLVELNVGKPDQAHLAASKSENSYSEGVQAEYLALLPPRPPSPSTIIITPRALQVLRYAKDEVILARHQKVEPPHLVLALIREAFLSEIEFCQNREMKIESVRAYICREHEILQSPTESDYSPPAVIHFSRVIHDVLRCAQRKATYLRTNAIDLNHLVLAIFDTEPVMSHQIAAVLNSTVRALERRLEQCTLRNFHLSRSSNEDESTNLRLHLFDLDTQITPCETVSTQFAKGKLAEKRLSHRSERVLGYAVHEARNFGHSQVSIETILLGLMFETFGPTFDAFSLLGITFPDSRAVLVESCARVSERTAARRPLSDNGRHILEQAWKIAQSWEKDEIEPEHILLAIADEHQGIASYACEALQIDGNVLRSELIICMQEAKSGMKV